MNAQMELVRAHALFSRSSSLRQLLSCHDFVCSSCTFASSCSICRHPYHHQSQCNGTTASSLAQIQSSPLISPTRFMLSHPSY